METSYMIQERSQNKHEKRIYIYIYIYIIIYREIN
ncbi:MAG: hypothetical protein ACI90V_011870, partial [Bacillariaceae sp.]|jgi:hypothetical protein